MPIEPHDGEVVLQLTFDKAHVWLRDNGAVSLVTSADTKFVASASVGKIKAHRNEAVIIFYQVNKQGEEREYGRAYRCCWGHYYNCNRTRIGMYCDALDKAAV